MNNNLSKIVTIVEAIDTPNCQEQNDNRLLASSRPSSPSPSQSQGPERCVSPVSASKIRAKLARTMSAEEIVLPEPTFSERFMRYLVLIIYLGGLSSLGFVLSIYYIFFWDSRMPPLYKPTKKPLYPKM